MYEPPSPLLALHLNTTCAVHKPVKTLIPAQTTSPSRLAPVSIPLPVSNQNVPTRRFVWVDPSPPVSFKAALPHSPINHQSARVSDLQDPTLLETPLGAQTGRDGVGFRMPAGVKTEFREGDKLHAFGRWGLGRIAMPCGLFDAV